MCHLHSVLILVSVLVSSNALFPGEDIFPEAEENPIWLLPCHVGKFQERRPVELSRVSKVINVGNYEDFLFAVMLHMFQGAILVIG